MLHATGRREIFCPIFVQIRAFTEPAQIGKEENVVTHSGKSGFGRRGLTDPTAHSALNAHPGEKWYVKISGEVYGPYSLTKLQSMKMENLIDEQTQVCSTSCGEWQTAATEAKVRFIFAANSGTAPATSQTAANNTTAPETAPFRKFMIFGRISSGVNREFERTLSVLGEWTEVMENCWALRSEHPLAYIRNTLTPVLNINDSVLITDSTNGKTISHNIGLEAEVKLKNLWL